MGKITKRVLGASVGKVGDVAFRKWRDLSIVQTYAAENPSKTEKQIAQRELMTSVTRDLKGLLCPFRLGFKFASPKSTQWAQGIKENFATLTPLGVFTPANYADIKLSKGGLKVPGLTHATLSAGSVVFRWNYSAINPCGKNNPSDQVVLVVAHLDENGVIHGQAVSTTALRSAGTATVTIPSEWGSQASRLALYAFAFNDDPSITDASDTEYILGE